MRAIDTDHNSCLIFYLFLMAWGERVKMEVKDGNDVLARRYYIGGVYEVDGLTGEERLYIGGDAYSAPAVDVCDADGQWELHYIGRDYLGSITLMAKYGYDAWGACRYWRAVRMLTRRAAVDSVVEAVSMSVESNVMEACE